MKRIINITATLLCALVLSGGAYANDGLNLENFLDEKTEISAKIEKMKAYEGDMLNYPSQKEITESFYTADLFSENENIYINNSKQPMGYGALNSTQATYADLAGLPYGPDNNGVSFNEETKTLEINITGDMPDLEYPMDAPWFSYASKIKKVIVGEGVTGIGSGSFYDLENLESVTLPKGLTSIGDYAFAECSKLSAITMEKAQLVKINASNMPKSAVTLICAYDENGKLLECANVEIENGLTQVEFNQPLAFSFKVFLFDNLENVKPLCVQGECIIDDINTERIVKTVDYMRNSDKEYFASYTVYNPYTGGTETIYGNYLSAEPFTAKYKTGDIVKTEKSQINDKTADSGVYGNVVINENNEKLFLITGYDDVNKLITVVSYDDVEKNYNPETRENSEVTLKTGAKIYTVSVNASPVTRIYGTNGEALIKWGGFGALFVSDLGSTGNTLRAYNAGFNSQTDETLKTVYAKYIKAYIDIDFNDNTDINADGSAKFVSVIVNDNEDLNYCELD